MALETIVVELRLRNAWEATDLGVAMVHRWFGSIYAAWFAVALPLFLLLHLLCWGNWWLTPWLFWWFKPWLDRPVLYILSQALFGNPPDRRQFWRDLPALLFRQQALAALLWRRFDTARSFTLPIGQLEGLTGKARRQRLRDLGSPGRGPATWLTIICINLEIVLDVAVVTLAWLLIPDFVAVEFFDLFDDSHPWGEFWLNVVGFCGISLVEPFYVAAGFSLYLNRRTWLEAWDLELGFRRMAARLAQTGRVAAVMAVLALGAGLLAVPLTGFAVEPLVPHESEALDKSLCKQRRQRENGLAQASSPVKQALAETLKEPELQVCQVRTVWRWRNEQATERPARPPRDSSFAQWFAAIVEILLWLALGIFVAIASWWMWRRAPHAWQRKRRLSNKSPVSPSRGGNTITLAPAAALGDTAWRLWIEGQPREALRLLYQGCLAGLATQHGLPIRPSATEDECLRLATRQLTDPELLGFFRRLTSAWQATAYAHRLPDEADAHNLCLEWSHHFTANGAPPA